MPECLPVVRENELLLQWVVHMQSWGTFHARAEDQMCDMIASGKWQSLAAMHVYDWCLLQGCGECFEVQCLENVSTARNYLTLPFKNVCSLQLRSPDCMDAGPPTWPCSLQGPLGDKPGSCQADPNNRTIVVMISTHLPALCLGDVSAYPLSLF